MKKHLTKSKNKKVLGVIGGFAERYGWDPTWSRIVFVFILLMTGIFPFGILYFVAAFVMDEPDELPTIR